MGRVIELPTGQIVLRYVMGESTRALGRAYGVDRTTIRQRLRAAGVKIRPGGGQFGNANALGSKSRLGWHKRGGPLYVNNHGHLRTRDRGGEHCYVHRGCWEARNGHVPKGRVVHHIDGDPLNNEIENLACMTQAEHRRLHASSARSATNTGQRRRELV